MKSQMKKTISILIGTVLFIALVHSDTYAQTNDFFARTIARDLVGKVITDPSQNYFTEDWILNRGEVLSVDIKQARNNGKKYAAIIIAHLKRGHLRVNAKMHVRYHYNGKRWVLTSTQVKLKFITVRKWHLFVLVPLPHRCPMSPMLLARKPSVRFRRPLLCVL